MGGLLSIDDVELRKNLINILNINKCTSLDVNQFLLQKKNPRDSHFLPKSDLFENIGIPERTLNARIDALQREFLMIIKDESLDQMIENVNYSKIFFSQLNTNNYIFPDVPFSLNNDSGDDDDDS
jgi:hypothetical protein